MDCKTYFYRGVIMTLPEAVINEKNKVATANAWLVLLEVILTDSTIFRLVRNDEDIVFEGDTYTAFNFQLDPTEVNSKGQIPTLTLRVSNVSFLLQAKMKELDGGIGSTVNMKVINSGLLASDFSDLEMNFEVLAASQTDLWAEFILGAPSLLRQRFPLNKYIASLCGFRFESAECSYDRKVVVGVTLSDPVSLEITAHDFEVDDAITLYTINGITGSIEGNYLIKADTNTNNVTLKTTAGVDVDGGDFAGSYTSGGEAGYTTCERTLTACRKRENAVRFGGFPGMRSGGVRIA